MLNTRLHIQQWSSNFRENWPREYRCSRTDKRHNNRWHFPKLITESSTQLIQHDLIRLTIMQVEREMDICFEKLV